MKPSKYKAKKSECDGIVFDSMVEMEYYKFLKQGVADGDIKRFTLQPEYVLQDSFKHPEEGHIRAIKYRADYRLFMYEGHEIIIDIKGVSTPAGLLKRKMFLKKYPSLDLKWISKSKKWGDDSGWIDYFELQKIRRENKKASQATIKQKTI